MTQLSREDHIKVLTESGAFNSLPLNARRYKYQQIEPQKGSTDFMGGDQPRGERTGKVVGIKDDYLVLKEGRDSTFLILNTPDFDLGGVKEGATLMGRKVTIPGYDPVSNFKDVVGLTPSTDSLFNNRISLGGSFENGIETLVFRGLQEHVKGLVGEQDLTSEAAVEKLAKADLDLLIPKTQDMLSQLVTLEHEHKPDLKGYQVLLNAGIKSMEFDLDSEKMVSTVAMKVDSPAFKGVLAVSYNLAMDDYTVASMSDKGVVRTEKSVYFPELVATVDAVVNNPPGLKPALVVEGAMKTKAKDIER